MPQAQYLNIPTWGSALGEFGSEFLSGRRERSEEDELSRILSQFDESTPIEEQARKLYGAKGISFDKKQQTVKGLADLAKKKASVEPDPYKTDRDNRMRQALLDAEVPEEMADLYIGASEGGRTKILSYLVDENPDLFRKFEKGVSNRRSGNVPPRDREVFTGEPEEDLSPNPPAPPEEEDLSPNWDPPWKQEVMVEEESFDIPEQDTDLSRKERVKREDDRFKVQLPLYDANSTKVKSLEDDLRNYDRLDELNAKMAQDPRNDEWFRQINIKQFGEDSGSLIFPAAATEDQQEWVKILSEFQRRAKESYGARITNFDLAQFMKRYPTLANTESGRARILHQLKLVGQMDQIYHKQLDNVIEKAGGLRKIDWDQAKRIAKKRSDKIVEPLMKQYKVGVSELEKQRKQSLKNAKKNLPEGAVIMIDENGRKRQVPKNKVKAQQGVGWELAK